MPSATVPSQPTAGKHHTARQRLSVAVAGFLLLVVLCLVSLAVGARSVSLSTVFDALTAYDARLPDHIAVRDYRLPRTLLGLLCGAGFGVSGAIIQAITRNALADPGLLGVNAGAAFFVTIAAGVFGLQAVSTYLWFAFLGAIVVTVIVYVLGSLSRAGATPVRLLLAGVAINALLGGLGSAIVLLDPVGFDSMRLWSIGALGGRDMAVVSAVAPFLIVGLGIAGLIAPAMNSIALGNDTARALGTHVVRSRILAAVSLTLLAGGGTAAVGPIGFIGLMTPHVVRWLFGPDQRLIFAGTMIFAPILLLSADIIGRLLLPGELEAGIVTAFIGAPVLILLVQRQKVSGL
ncbi:iron chelate uptake ABC transporter family permease subunit [Rhizobium sp. VS19-DR104.2]|uniref:iron chelate uptake ABC transporter family permease subunit n=1 Tax=unclassified Rhizobium TaxID=2613769 RepID=UPI001CC37523|nr:MULTISPECIES: iron chelate uptake ABC transporter family permease subunit [unclassified Rhizobium]MBZ5761819.1 iron chelate uptake ABC transporter family permease subunit [Rhizobium sp. VS19-DR96]MBZ5767987.1 iron chelate uptake ABC transporter family permease subunit [Rhizobium sp. VS19-DR129.2]MBZ5775335.1 iron chelate uptake ABC transporter family permease subunit [Rhizobium sp. VS19-DRK62.2]MBZ5786698.1 iron chelate uptake ABC transporter family permease subunit [Rhizobium sp. VS19-DR121